MAPQPTSAPVKAVLLPRQLLIVETVSRCSAATSVTEIALLDRLDPTTPSAAPGINALTRSGDRTIRANPAALQSASFCQPGFIPGRLRQFDICQLNYCVARQDYSAIGEQAF
jgi:hypothetical protein